MADIVPATMSVKQASRGRILVIMMPGNETRRRYILGQGAPLDTRFKASAITIWLSAFPSGQHGR